MRKRTDSQNRDGLKMRFWRSRMAFRPRSVQKVAKKEYSLPGPKVSEPSAMYYFRALNPPGGVPGVHNELRFPNNPRIVIV